MNEMDFECQNYLKNVQNNKSKQKKKEEDVLNTVLRLKMESINLYQDVLN